MDGTVVEARGSCEESNDRGSLIYESVTQSEKVVVPLFVLSFSPCAHSLNLPKLHSHASSPKQHLCRSSPKRIISDPTCNCIVVIYRRGSNLLLFPQHIDLYQIILPARGQSADTKYKSCIITRIYIPSDIDFEQAFIIHA